MAVKASLRILVGALALLTLSADNYDPAKPKPKPKPRPNTDDDGGVVGDDVLALDTGFCAANNFENYERCGTNGFFGHSFCQVNANGDQLCFADFLCNATSPCTSDADCGSGLTCAINGCGTVCSPQCAIDVSGWGGVYTVGGCYAADYVASDNAVLNNREVGEPCDPNKRDAAGTYKCEESVSTSFLASITTSPNGIVMTGGALVALVALGAVFAVYPRQAQQLDKNDVALPDTSEYPLVSAHVEVELEKTRYSTHHPHVVL